MPELAMTSTLMHYVPSVIRQHLQYSTRFYYFHGSKTFYFQHRKNSKNTTILYVAQEKLSTEL
jgi:hypothetical protein